MSQPPLLNVTNPVKTQDTELQDLTKVSVPCPATSRIFINVFRVSRWD